MNRELIRAIDENPLAAVIEYYAACLHHNQRAVDFLQRQALCADARLQVGFADRTLGTHLPSNRTKAGVQIRSKLQSAGILKENGRERFRGLVTVPLSDFAGEVTGIYGLRVDPTQGEKETTLGSGIFNARAVKRFEEVILCQSILDAWALCGAGHTHAIAAEGVELSAEMFINVNRILLAGSFGHDHFTGLFTGLFTGKELLQIRFPDDLGAQRYAKRSSSVPDALGQRIRAASWISGGSPDRTAEKPGGEVLAIEGTEDAEVAEVAEAGAAKCDADTDQEKDARLKPLATPLPSPPADPAVESTDTETTIMIEDRRWRVRGLERNRTLGVLRLNVAIFNHRSGRFHVDQFDLYHSRSRRVFLKEAAEETGLAEADLRYDIGTVVMKLEELQQQQLCGGSEAKQERVQMTDAERSDAMRLLRDEKLLDRILDDFDACGIVGEQAGKLAGYLAATSRLLEKPLGLVIQSSSAAGKSALADSILRFMPSEETFRCSAMTSQSLYYLGKENLQHKILSIAEEEGVREASYQLKLLQSEGQLSLVSTSKETGTGRTTAERYEVRGPVALLMTTTSLTVDPELMNRSLVITIDESVAQTEAILQQQRFAQTLEGWKQETHSKQIIKLHQNAQRLLRRLPVFNPYAEQLGFIGSQTRHRRDHAKYLSVIKVVTLLHQYQHEIKRCTVDGQQVEYLEVTRGDIARANTIADWALGRSIDELAGPTRRLLVQLYDWIRERAGAKRLEVGEVEFTRREAREALDWSATQLSYHLERLCRDEYAIRAGGGAGKLCKYRLLYDGRGREGQAALIGLVDAASLVEPSHEPMSDDLSA